MVIQEIKIPFVKNKKTSLIELLSFVAQYYAISLSFKNFKEKDSEYSSEKFVDENYTHNVKYLCDFLTKLDNKFEAGETILIGLLDLKENKTRMNNIKSELCKILKNIISDFKGLEYVAHINEGDYFKENLIDWTVIYENNYWMYKDCCDNEKPHANNPSSKKNIDKNEIIKFLFEDNFNLLYMATILYLAGIVFMSTIENLDIVYENTEYACFIVLKWLITASSGWNTYKIYKKNVSSKWLLVFSAIAVLFNPIFKIPFEQESWYIIDFVVLIIYFVYFVKFYKNENK